MEMQILTPGMQHGEEADLRAQVFRVAGNGKQGLRRGTEQDVVDHIFVVEGDAGQWLGDSEDHMEVLGGQQLGGALLEALPYLAMLLQSPDAALVRAGVVGLSFYANGVGMQTPSAGMDHLNYRAATPYATDETARYLGFDERRSDEYIAFWKNWWNIHQSEFR